MVCARMAPRPDRKMQQPAAFILVLQRAVDRRAAIAVLLVPLTDLDQLLKDWRSGGGDQMRNDYQRAYAAAKAA